MQEDERRHRWALFYIDGRPECTLTLGVLFGGQHEVAEAEHALSETAQFHVGRVEGLLLSLVQRLPQKKQTNKPTTRSPTTAATQKADGQTPYHLFAVDEDGRAAFQDALGGALHDQDVAAVVLVFVLVDRHLNRRTKSVRLSRKAVVVGSECTWYLLEELKGISQIFLLRARKAMASPVASSTHLSSAASEASPLTSRYVFRLFCVEKTNKQTHKKIHCFSFVFLFVFFGFSPSRWARRSVRS